MGSTAYACLCWAANVRTYIIQGLFFFVFLKATFQPTFDAYAYAPFFFFIFSGIEVSFMIPQRDR